MADNTLASSPLKTLQDSLKQAAPAMSAVAAKMVTPDKLIKIAVAAAQRTPLLLQCTPQSIVRAVIQGAELGLTPGSALNQAYLVPFKNGSTYEAQLIVSAGGLCELAYRTGLVSSIDVEVVYEGDEFEYELGLTRKLRHIPADETIDATKITHAYAIVTFKDGTTAFKVMTRKGIDRIRNISKAKDSGPWVGHYAEMAKKTVVKNLMKYIPKSIEVMRAVALDNAQESGDYSLVDFDSVEALGSSAPAIEQSTVGKVTDKITGAISDSPLVPFGMTEQEEADFRSLAESNGKNLEDVARATEPKTLDALEAALNGQEVLL